MVKSAEKKPIYFWQREGEKPSFKNIPRSFSITESQSARGKFKPDEDGWKDMQEFISKHKSKQSIL